MLLAAACGGADERAGEGDATARVTAAADDPAAGGGSTTSPTASGGAASTAPDEGEASVPTLADGSAAPERSADPAPAPDERPLPASAEELTAELDELESALRAPGIDEPTAAPWGRRQQALYGLLSFHPEWADEVLAGVDPSIRDAVALNWTARQELIALVRSHGLSDTLPAWRIGPARPADELLGYYREAEAATGVPWEILASINLIETRMGRIQGVSTAGAIGPMQFLPTTWAECCEGDPNEPRDAINGAARYLVQRGGDDDLDRAIFGYNNSDHYVKAVTSYAEVMAADENAYYGYHAWEVYFLSTAGLVVLTEGYEQPEPVDAAAYLEANPGAGFPGE